jgi:hypothetical protein
MRGSRLTAKLPRNPRGTIEAARSAVFPTAQHLQVRCFRYCNIATVPKGNGRSVALFTCDYNKNDTQTLLKRVTLRFRYPPSGVR